MKYLSPSSLSEYLKSPAEFYVTRMAENKKPRMAQTRPMSVGSAFDAYVKSWIHERLIGSTRGTEYDLNTLLAEQCSAEHLEWATIAGAKCFDAYQVSGALASLCADLKCGSNIRMEKTITGTVEGVTLLGKPDLEITLPVGSHFILDWKVNGYCSKASPKRGYTIIRDGWNGVHSRSHNGMHKDAIGGTCCGIPINIGMNLESIDESWARQVATYAWLLGATVGSYIVCGIDQLACSPKGIRIASFRMPISKSFQLKSIQQYQELWDLCNDPVRFCDHHELDKKVLDNMYCVKNEKDAFFHSLW